MREHVWLSRRLTVTSLFLLMALGGLDPRAGYAQGREPGSGMIEGHVTEYVQAMVDIFVKVRTGNLTIEFEPDEKTIIVGDITKVGTLVRMTYRDLRKDDDNPNYKCAPLRIEVISNLTTPAPTPGSLSLAAPEVVHRVAKPGFYLTIFRCHGCYYDDWQNRVSALFQAGGIGAVPGNADWDTLKTGILKIYEHKHPEWTTEVLVGPVSDLKSLGRLIGRLPEILGPELTSQQENRDLRRLSTNTFELGRFDVRTFPPVVPDFATSWFQLPVVRIAFWVMVLCALIASVFIFRRVRSRSEI